MPTTEPVAGPVLSPGERDPLHEGSPPELHWTTTNVGEAMPGVLTPLSWSVWRPVGRALPDFGHSIGALTAAERDRMSTPDGQPMRIFFGRAAFGLEYFALLGDRLPGTTGPRAAESLLGHMPDGLVYRPTTRRYPVVACRFPMVFSRVPARVRAAHAETATWYRESLDAIPTLDRDGATRLLLDARERLVRLVTLQLTAVAAGLQPVYDALEKLVAEAGVGDVATLSGAGGAEMVGLVGDLWKVSRGLLDIETVVREHGFHGPLEGELSSLVWREDPSPLHRLVCEYARRDERADPVLREQARAREAARMRPELLAALPRSRRPVARVVLALAARRLPLRGVVKESLLQAFDVARAAARHLGAHLAAAGVLAEPGDVFFLTVDELSDLPGDLRELVATRKQRREAYRGIDIPADWRGSPEPAAREPGRLDGGAVLTGIGVSAGTVEGVVRVVVDPSEELEPDEILVAPTTDPSWSSIMFVSRALVVDIGGVLSHAAVVARELGLPCVVNTRTGTRTLRSGDRVRVDGSAGTVEILERAPDPAGAPAPSMKEATDVGR
ncbi:MAG TPA: PEP-utilizing enzyme [Pseudonocardia sp.]|nr:PEP-utilizing enzyme [Pseudonocardia sp.]